MHLVIIDSPDAVYTESCDQFVLWQSYGEEAFPNAVSVPLLIEKNANALRTRYLELIHDLGEARIQKTELYKTLQLRPEFSYWWMTLMVEKSNWAKSPQITEIIRLFAFDDWVKNFQEIKSIQLVSASPELHECLRNWCQTKNIHFKCRQLTVIGGSTSRFKRAFDRLPHTIQAMFWLVKYTIERWPLRGVGVVEWTKSQTKITFVSYFFNLHAQAAQQGRFGSNYWTELPNILSSSEIQSSWLHTYIKSSVAPNAKSAANLLKSFNTNQKGEQVHVALDSFLSIKIIVRAIQDYLTIRKISQLNTATVSQCLVKDSQLIESLLWPLFKRDWERSFVGIDAIRNLLTLNLYEEAFLSLPKQTIGIYLQENQGWEFGMIHAWRANSHGKLTGFPHSTVRYWDLRHFFDFRSYQKQHLSIPLPDYQAVSGEEIKNAYLTGGYPVEDIVEIEALRFLYLDEMCKKNPQKRQSSQKLQLLVLGEYSSINTSLQMNFLRLIAKELSNVELTVKPHPACPINPGDYPELKFRLSNQPLSDLFELFDVAYTSCLTSAAVDAYCAGLQVISVLDSTVLNLSPLRGVNGVKFVSSPEELRDVLQEAPGQVDVPTEQVNYFNVDSSLPRWSALLLNSIKHEKTRKL